MVGMGRFELPASRPPDVRANQAALHPAYLGAYFNIPPLESQTIKLLFFSSSTTFFASSVTTKTS